MHRFQTIFISVIFSLSTSWAFAQCPGNLDGNATILAADSCVYTAGTVTQGANFFTQTLTIEPGAELVINGDFLIFDNIINNGKLTVNGDVTAIIGAAVTVAQGAVFNVFGDYTNGGFITSGSAGVDGLLNVTGTFNNTGNGTVDVGPTGTLQANPYVDNGTTNNSGICNANGCCGSCTYGLPVVLTDFQVQENKFGEAVIEWSTAQEKDNEYFEVQKMIQGGIDFEVIAIVSGRGTTEELHSYQITDRNFTKDAYFRLRQVDFDGHSETFPAKVLSKADRTIDIPVTLYPNPTDGPIFLRGNSYSSFNLYNLQGQIISTGSGMSTTQIEDLINQSLEPRSGHFILQLMDEGRSETLRIHKR